MIWAGIALLIGNMGFLDDTVLDGWDLVFTGAGVIVLLVVLVRLLVPTYRQPVIGTFIVALVLLSIGLGDLVSWALIWPLVIIFIGLVMLLRGFGGRG